MSNTGQLKTMRLAQSCNGEYSNFFGAFNSSQVALVLAAFNATLTRANGVYEKDLAVHLNLIASTTNVIYYDPATDPYTNLNSWNSQLQATLTANIGEANYDIGHMFGASGGGGNAGCIGCVCVDGQKGRGITSPADSIPMGDNFDIDYVVHEVGHQMGANHTFSFQLEGSGQNKEVGSGITIMGYAGITGQDVAPHSIDTFHETSIQQIQNNLANKTCPVTTVMTANHPPVVAPVSNFTIPISTPFALTGSATDPEGDALTYQWEQNDNATTSGANSVASPTKVTGPNWLSFVPTSSPTRLFPKLSTLQAGLLVTPPLPGGDAGANIEALSSVSRTLNFRLTVRDNRPYVAGSTIGQTQFTDMTVTVSNTAGPFNVTAPNTAVSWAGGSNQTVTWNVANTTLPPVSAANVKISLSTDGGNTFPIVIAASTPNDGSEAITVPSAPSTTARIKVEAVGNVFFDISNANFTITGAAIPPYRAPYDFDGDNKSDVSTWRGSDGFWNALNSGGGTSSLFWGNESLGDKMVPGDYDGNGRTDYAVYRSSTGVWYINLNNSGAVLSTPWGASSDVPVPADYDGDGKTDIAVYRPTEGSDQGIWYILKSSDNFNSATHIRRQWGNSTDKPIPADYDFDGKADYAIARPDSPSAGLYTWWISLSTGGVTAAQWGLTSDKIVVGDYDGDRKADLAIWRPSNGNWYIVRSTGGSIGPNWGLAGDVPVPADYDGDGRTDLGVFRPSDGNWYILGSTSGVVIQSFGGSGQAPVPSSYVP
ncbi:MAG: reprolysin-like metallopeptidase [Pyrinomonadaceae bacterium]